MKITILTGPFMCLPPYSIGAVEKLWAALGQNWLSKGNKVTFICKKPESVTDQENYIYIKGYSRTGNWMLDFLLDFVYSVKALNDSGDKR